LRYDLGLTGTKIGCNEAECGDLHRPGGRRAVDSCIYPALRASGTSVTTIEGLEHNGALDALQRNFIAHGRYSAASARPA